MKDAIVRNYGVTLIAILTAGLGVAYTTLRIYGIEDTAVLGAALTGGVAGLLGLVKGSE